MIINDATLQALRVNLERSYQDGLKKAQSSWKKVATEMPSSAAANVYAWLGEFPLMKEWVSKRQIKDLKENSYTLPNKSFESTIGVPRTAIEDDNCGMYGVMAQQMGQSAEDHIDTEVFKLLPAGFAALCYDGQNFFDADHPVYPNHDGTGTAKSVSNIVNPSVTDGPGWYLIYNNGAIKPLIYQNRKPATFTAMTDTHDESVFMENLYRYGTDARRGFGYGFWQMAVGSRDSLTAANFTAAYQMMMGFVADGGKPLGLVPSLLVVPPALLSAAEDILNKEFLASGESNVNYHKVELLCTPWLA